VPAFLADRAKGVVAVFTDGHAFCHWRQLVFGAERIKSIFIIGNFQIVGQWVFRFWVTLGSCCSLAPFSRAVDGVLIGFYLLLALEKNVSLNCLRRQRYLKELARSNTRIALFAGWRLAVALCWKSLAVLAVRCHAFHTIYITLVDAGSVEILQATDAENVGAAQQSMAKRTLLWFEANSAFKSSLFKLFLFRFYIEVQ
jgi:hypothetical protein